MKKLITLLLSLVCVFSYAQKFEWVSSSAQFSSNGQNSPTAMDAAGNIYTYINGTNGGWPIVFQGDTLQHFGGAPYSTAIVKMDANGTKVWTKMISFGQAYSIGVDNSGNVYIGGRFDGPLTQTDDTTYSNTTVYQVMKIDANGNFAKASFISSLHVPIVTVDGNFVYVAYNWFVEKRDASLNVIWIKSAPAGSVYFNWPGTSNIFVEGNRIVVTVLEGSGLSTPVPFSNDSIYFSPVSENAVVTMDTSGQLLWSYTCTGQPTMTGITIDNQGNIYVGASGFSSTYIFGNDTMFNTLGPPQPYAIIFKWDASGNPLNATPIYTNIGQPFIYDMDANAQDEIVLTVWTHNGITMIHNTVLPAYRYSLVKLDAAGNVVWVKLPQGAFYMYGIRVRNGNEYLLSGTVGGTAQFGCIPVSPGIAPEGNYVTLISEQQEPVPVTNFTTTQSGNAVLFKEQMQNATSFYWTFGDALTSNLEEPLHTYTESGIYNACLVAANNCGLNQTCKTIVVKGLRAIASNRGSNDGVITVEIFGGGFTSNTTVLLKKTGSTNITPYYTHFIDQGKLEVRLDLISQTVGAWDVEVNVPGDTIMTLAGGFTVDGPSDYSFDVTGVGPGAFRPNRWQPSLITIHNNSNKDAVGVTMFYRIDNSWLSYVPASFISPQQVSFLNAGYQYLSNNGISTTLTDHVFIDTTTASRIGSVIIPLIKANSSYTFPLYIRGTVDIVSAKIVTIGATLAESSSLTGNFSPSTDICFSEYFKNAIEKSLAISIPAVQWDACFPALFDSIRMIAAVQANTAGYNTPVSLPAAVVSMLSSMATAGCITGIPAVLTEVQIKTVIKNTLNIITDTSHINTIIPFCNYFSQLREEPGLPSPQFSGGAGVASALVGCGAAGAVTGLKLAFAPPIAAAAGVGVFIGCLIVINSIDPNDISGPGNNSDDIYQRPGDMSSYTISFENDAAASAPAQIVTIIDTLDVSRVDAGTFRFTSITIGDSLKIEFTSPGMSQLKVSSLAPFNTDLLRTEATFDSTSGKIEWVLTTVDNINYQPIANPLGGFLPPNLNGTEGTGHVSYDVRLKSTLVTGDQIDNTASIVFDNNAPIATNIWHNVIDIEKPQSAVNALPPNINTASFIVTWSGSDLVAGIRTYDIYVSENDQPYQLWMMATDTTQNIFNGINGIKYEFISIAMDGAGNIEDAPVNPTTNPDAVTTVTTSIFETDNNVAFELTPNPVKSFLFIKSNELITALKVYDVMGKEICSMELIPIFNFALQTDDMAAGIYFIEIFSQKNKGQRKFIKID